MKKNIKILSLLIVAVMLCCILVSCSGGNVAKSGTATILVDSGNGEYTSYSVDLSKLDENDEGALSLLEYLATQKDVDFNYTAQSGAYGAYITNINKLSPDPLSEYIAVYTSEASDFSVSSDGMEMPSVKYGEVELKYSGVGISEMKINDGTVVMFRLESFG